MKFLPHFLYNYSYSAYQGLFEILILTVVLCAKTVKNTFFSLFRYFVIFAKVKNRMICTKAIKLLNLKPFDFFVSDNPSLRFNQQRTH